MRTSLLYEWKRAEHVHSSVCTVMYDYAFADCPRSIKHNFEIQLWSEYNASNQCMGYINDVMRKTLNSVCVWFSLWWLLNSHVWTNTSQHMNQYSRPQICLICVVLYIGFESWLSSRDSIHGMTDFICKSAHDTSQKWNLIKLWLSHFMSIWLAGLHLTIQIPGSDESDAHVDNFILYVYGSADNVSEQFVSSTGHILFCWNEINNCSEFWRIRKDS